VEYDGAGFLEKNRDSLPGGANELMQASKNPLIELIYKGSITMYLCVVLYFVLCAPIYMYVWEVGTCFQVSMSTLRHVGDSHMQLLELHPSSVHTHGYVHASQFGLVFCSSVCLCIYGLNWYCIGTLTRTGTLALGSVSSRRTGRLKKKPVSGAHCSAIICDGINYRSTHPLV